MYLRFVSPLFDVLGELFVDVRHAPHHTKRVPAVPRAVQSRMSRGQFDVVSLSTRAMHPRGAHARTS